MASFEMTITAGLAVRCALCDKDLELLNNVLVADPVQIVTVKVKPCSHCMVNKKDDQNDE